MIPQATIGRPTEVDSPVNIRPPAARQVRCPVPGGFLRLIPTTVTEVEPLGLARAFKLDIRDPGFTLGLDRRVNNWISGTRGLEEDPLWTSPRINHQFSGVVLYFLANKKSKQLRAASILEILFHISNCYFNSSITTLPIHHISNTPFEHITHPLFISFLLFDHRCHFRLRNARAIFTRHYISFQDIFLIIFNIYITLYIYYIICPGAEFCKRDSPVYPIHRGVGSRGKNIRRSISPGYAIITGVPK